LSGALGIAAYRALSWRNGSDHLPPFDPRPVGQVLWCHATSTERVRALSDLGLRIKAQRDDLNLLITVGADVPIPTARTGAPRPIRLGSDHPQLVRQFLDHWQPDLCLWAGGDWMPNLIWAASERGVAMKLVDLSESDLMPRRRWGLDLTRACVMRFETILLTSTTAAAHLRRMGIASTQFEVSTQLHSDANPAPCDEDTLSRATSALGARPLWLASDLVPQEFGIVLSAHLEALRRQHRLLLAIIPARSDRREDLLDEVDRVGLNGVEWVPGDPISEHVQIILCRNEDLEIWYRLAPLTLLGGSFRPGVEGRDPLPAIALGSAVLTGPFVSNFKEAYARLTRAGGARIVQTGPELSEAVSTLVQPANVAKMALAGWEVVTESAALVDRLVDMVQDRLDDLEFSDAGA
jgi:3-deoxy-D-manno-octulosonic-acid transferase